MPKYAHCGTETEFCEDGNPICVTCANSGTPPTRKPTVVAVSNIRDAIFQDMLAATALLNIATREFDRVIGQFPAGPDGAKRIRNASQDLEAARKEYARAHDRLNEFLSRGIIPEDLKPGVGQ
jgi:hypothetical protein